MCYRLGIIGAIEQFLKVTYREVQLMLLHQTFAPFYHGDTTSVAQICVADLLCYAGLLPRHEEDAAVDGPQACVCLSFTSSVCKPPNG